MRQDEQPDDQRIQAQAGQHALVQQHAVVEAQGGGIGDEAAQQEVDHAGQHQHAKHVGDQTVQVADHPRP